MLVLFETPAGFALFKLLDEGKLAKEDNIFKYFRSAEKAQKLVQLKAFHKFEDTTDAMAATTAIVEGKLGKSLKKFLKGSIVKKGLTDQLAVMDTKLGGAIKEKLGIACVHNNGIMELMRGIRSQLTGLIEGLSEKQLKSMMLGLGHSLSRYKLKFSPDKVDTMIVQAVGLLDELDKEINTYGMRVKEWYGWHFPEMVKIVVDNLQYAQTALKMGVRANASTMDFSDILAEEVEEQMKQSAIISMGTDISETDVINIGMLCDQVISLSEYRATLWEYLQNRMNAVAPNLSVMVGELVGARLIAHAGSLMNLAKQPASTVQILGAEKALFRALKTKHETPKYGLIYHASLVGQAAPKNKGKISRVLAAKTALAIRVDALGESSEATIALEGRAKVEARLRQLEGGRRLNLTGGAAGRSRTGGVGNGSAVAGSYSAASDVTMGGGAGGGAGASASASASEDVGAQAAAAAPKTPKSAKKDKKAKKDKSAKKAKKGTKRAREEDDDGAAAAAEAAAATPASTNGKTPKSDKKKKKDKKAKKMRV